MTRLEKTLLVAFLALLAWGFFILMARDVVLPVLTGIRGVLWYVFSVGEQPKPTWWQ